MARKWALTSSRISNSGTPNRRAIARRRNCIAASLGRTGMTIGRFHDSCANCTTSRVYLHPWTGPLYELPDPPFALLIGHETLYTPVPEPDAAQRLCDLLHGGLDHDPDDDN